MTLCQKALKITGHVGTLVVVSDCPRDLAFVELQIEFNNI